MKHQRFHFTSGESIHLASYWSLPRIYDSNERFSSFPKKTLAMQSGRKISKASMCGGGGHLAIGTVSHCLEKDGQEVKHSKEVDGRQVILRVRQKTIAAHSNMKRDKG